MACPHLGLNYPSCDGLPTSRADAHPPPPKKNKLVLLTGLQIFKTASARPLPDRSIISMGRYAPYAPPPLMLGAPGGSSSSSSSSISTGQQQQQQQQAKQEQQEQQQEQLAQQKLGAHVGHVAALLQGKRDSDQQDTIPAAAPDSIILL